MTYLIYFLLSLGLSLLLVPVLKRVALRFGFIDAPTVARKLHSKPTPLLGGVAVWLAWLGTLCAYLLWGSPDVSAVPPHFFLSIIVGTGILVCGGVLDDKYNLKPYWQLLFPASAALIVVLSGIGLGITFVTSPFGDKLWLNWNLLFLPASGVFTWLWIMGMTYTTKILDGMDGLASGIGMIGGGVMFLLSLAPHINQPTTAVLSLILAGALLGFLRYGFHPASIFLGESGSTFIGFILGVLAVLSGAKIATALLVMAVPIIDVAWAIVRRIFHGQSPFHADRGHIHHLLLVAGLSQRQVALFMYTTAAAFGVVAVYLETAAKAAAFAGVVLAVIILLSWLLNTKRTVVL